VQKKSERATPAAKALLNWQPLTAALEALRHPNQRRADLPRFFMLLPELFAAMNHASLCFCGPFVVTTVTLLAYFPKRLLPQMQ
jgi:hypothetical protein